MPLAPYRLPNNVFGNVLLVSWRHQIALVSLTVFTFLLEIVPLEIQRRVVNNLVKERPFQLVIILCAAYASAALVQGATKLGLNVYRSWVGENSKRDLRRHIISYLRIARAMAPGPEARDKPPRRPPGLGIEAARHQYRRDSRNLGRARDVGCEADRSGFAAQHGHL
jgi:hypothetical protein